MRYAQKYLEEARADERAAKKKQGYRYDEKRDVLDEDDDDDDDDDDDGDDGGDDDSEDGRVGARLRAAREAEAASAFERLGARLEALGFDGDVAASRKTVLAGHRGPVTCVAICESSGQVWSGSKDNALLLHDAATGARVRTLLPRWPQRASEDAREAEVLAVACSADGRYAATAGSDGLVHVWDARSARLAHSLRGHKGRVTCLAFRDDAHARLGGGDDDGLGGGDASSQLFSGGDDGSVKHWGAKAGAYVETLFGHEAPVAALDCAYEEKPLSGGRDRTARCWKIRDESHLVYRSPTAGGLGSSVDACRVLDRDRFLTGGDDGALSLWSARRKKPVVSVKRAHGAGAAAQALGAAAAGDVSAHVPRWLQSVAAPRHADVVASGSCDGAVRLWTVDDKDAAKQVLEPFAALPQLGFVNGLAAPRDAAFLAAAVAKEPRLGRWEKVAKAKNCVVLYPLLNSGSAL
ncbi:hypothetical protein AURANDRAFT_23083 [Aureococcus anophagefferens]|uniref:Uncharacterized protein n=1 Tax=Aureococcus anophagefferens TaxID=44056 RepID=F0Y2W4_AURAN|nr:hypothetical protein AURANDRAFT_23083 [Aureococcus anophagefferens]EGB10154.1 hypothetical protein AURANDRAFT_23083 [Aureococcus anophagefferens]|eukprot:XP_009034979.1 hypothetical protein AURANDRAFT_23083 [Aureococcus anophagefferens]